MSAPIQSQNITDGVASPSKYPAVVSISMSSGSCTGTFVSHNTLLTAAHCLYTKATDSSESDSETSFVFANGMAAEHWSIHPLYAKTPNPVNQYDIALVKFPDHSSSHWMEVSSKGTATGESVEIIGFGLTDSESLWSSGKKYWGCNSISQQSGRFFHMTGQLNNPTGDQRTDCESTVQSGDSGGPMVKDNLIIGVASGTANYASYAKSYHAKLSNSTNWKFLNDAISLHDFEIPSIRGEQPQTNESDCLRNHPITQVGAQFSLYLKNEDNCIIDLTNGHQHKSCFKYTAGKVTVLRAYDYGNGQTLVKTRLEFSSTDVSDFELIIDNDSGRVIGGKRHNISWSRTATFNVSGGYGNCGTHQFYGAMVKQGSSYQDEFLIFPNDQNFSSCENQSRIFTVGSRFTLHTNNHRSCFLDVNSNRSYRSCFKHKDARFVVKSVRNLRGEIKRVKGRLTFGSNDVSDLTLEINARNGEIVAGARDNISWSRTTSFSVHSGQSNCSADRWTAIFKKDGDRYQEEFWLE